MNECLLILASHWNHTYRHTKTEKEINQLLQSFKGISAVGGNFAPPECYLLVLNIFLQDLLNLLNELRKKS